VTFFLQFSRSVCFIEKLNFPRFFFKVCFTVFPKVLSKGSNYQILRFFENLKFSVVCVEALQEM